jgi:Transglycosylase SLT domain
MANWWTLSAVGVALSLSMPAQSAAAAPDRKAFAASVCAAIDKASATHNLDRIFFTRLLWKESLFDPNAVSPTGAQGIAQFMPATAELRKLDDPFDPLSAIAASASFLSDLKKLFGNIGLAAAAYNAGEGRVTRWLAGESILPDETEAYVAFVTGKVADDWKEKTAIFAMPVLGKSGDFNSQCIAMASRQVNPTGGGARRIKAQPWGALLAADFNETRAFGMFKRLKLRFPQALDGVQPFVMRKANLSRGRKKMAFVMVGAKTQVEAQALCAKYAGVGLPCVVRKNG